MAIARTHNTLLLLTFLYACCGVSSLYAQGLSADNDSVRWTVSTYRNPSTGETISHPCHFDSTSDDIKWVQQGDEEASVSLFNISSSEGSWSDVGQDGSLTRHVTMASLSGTIQFKRENGQTHIVMSLLKEGVNVASYEFTVTEISKTENP